LQKYPDIFDHMSVKPSLFLCEPQAMFASSVLRAPRIPRSALSTQPRLGGAAGTFAIPCRKVVVEYCEKSVASKGTRDYLLQQAVSIARAYPSVEFVVIPRPQKSPVLRGFYRK
jgi:hypothetical protein